MSSYAKEVRQFAALYPQPEIVDVTDQRKFTSYRQELKQLLIESSNKLLIESDEVNKLVDKFLVSKSSQDLQLLCNELFNLLPIETNGIYHPMLPTYAQLQRYLSSDMQNIGDCKLLTVVCAYICNVMAGIPSLLSVRSYNGHPILYLNLADGVHRVSFRYNGVVVKPYRGVSPFELTAEEAYDSNFTDKDFKVGEEQSTLYWDILNAIFILDMLNILRRCVVNFAFHPDEYLSEFESVIQYLEQTNIYSEPVICYWVSEMERVSSLWRDPRSNKNPEAFTQQVIDSLRFTE